jgi:hypothetical protein
MPLTLLFNDSTDIDDYVDVARGIRAYDRDRKSFNKMASNFIPNSIPYFDIYEQDVDHITYLFNRMAEIKERIHVGNYEPNLEKFGEQKKQLDDLSSFMNEYNTIFDLQGMVSEEQMEKLYKKYNLTMELVNKLMPLYDMYLREIRLSNKEECELELVNIIDELVMYNSRFAYIFATYLFNGFDVHKDRMYIVAYKGLLDAINNYTDGKPFEGLLLYHINTRVRRNMTRLYGADYESFLDQPNTKETLKRIETYTSGTAEIHESIEKLDETIPQELLENVYKKMIDLKLFDLDDISKREYILAEGVNWSLDKINEEYEKIDLMEKIIERDISLGMHLEEIAKHIKDELGIDISVEMINYIIKNN